MPLMEMSPVIIHSRIKMELWSGRKKMSTPVQAHGPFIFSGYPFFRTIRSASNPVAPSWTPEMIVISEMSVMFL